MQEEFKVINDFPNYSVSNIGRVKNELNNKILKSQLDKNGYVKVKLFNNGKKKSFLVHRLVGEAFIPNPQNKTCIDHIDNNPSNNNVNNLRFATIKENAQNKKMNKNNTSGYKGVYYENGKWRARINHNNKYLSLGYFNTKEEAALARLEKAKEIYGEFMNDCENKITININAEQVIINN